MTSPDQSLARSVHDARRLRQAGDLDGALALLAGVDMATAQNPTRHAGRTPSGSTSHGGGSRIAGRSSTAPARDCAAVLAPRGDGNSLEVLAVLGMRWRPGKTTSRRSLRGLRPLAGVPA